ncbi:MAG: four helix bundle protein [bacterium]|nr:four helix bundle protein [bacterium]
MTENLKKTYDLEERTLEFAKCVRNFVKKIPKTTGNLEDGKQLIRSSGSMGANYIEANESLSRKDFLMRIKICRKESKETIYWLKLLDIPEVCVLERNKLVTEASELMKIFGSIIQKSV